MRNVQNGMQIRLTILMMQKRDECKISKAKLDPVRCEVAWDKTTYINRKQYKSVAHE